MYTKIAQFVFILIVSPFLFGIINRSKAFFAGRRGIPVLQLYHDIFKLFRKGAVYSRTTTWIFVAAPIVGLSSLLVAAMLIPFAGHPALIAFNGDIILFIYLLGLARFFSVLAAVDAGSSFGGMGASREVQFALFAEPAFFLSLAALARLSGQLSLSGIFTNNFMSSWVAHGPLIFLVLGALFIVFLVENSRIPVDDPNTHLELTMIHEVMVLDHGGVDLAYVLCSGAIKFWLIGTLMVGLFQIGHSFGGLLDVVIFILGMIVLAFVVGIVESVLARFRLLKIPHFLIVATALSLVALILSMR